MLVYGIFTARSTESVELFLDRARAEEALEDVAADDAALAALLRIVPLELGGPEAVSLN